MAEISTTNVGELVSTADGNRPLPFDRDTFGRMVREAWVRWAETQPNPKPSWLVPYDELSESDKEADRQIGEAIARWTLIGDAALTAISARDEWAEKRAAEITTRALRRGMSNAPALKKDLLTALREAEERVRAEERAHAAEALKLAHAMQEKAGRRRAADRTGGGVK